MVSNYFQIVRLLSKTQRLVFYFCMCEIENVMCDLELLHCTLNIAVLRNKSNVMRNIKKLLLLPCN